MKQKRILYFIDNLSFGGTQTSLVNLCRGLHQKKYEQSIICLNGSFSQEILDIFAQLQIPVLIIGKLKLISGIGFFQIYFKIKKFKPHLIQTFLPYGDLMGRLMGWITGVQNIYSSIRARNIDKSKLWLLFDRITMPIAKKVIFNSQPVISFSKEYEGVKDSQVIYIPNGIDLPQIDISPLQEWKKENHISHDIKIIGMIGRLSEQKAYADAISAFSKTENTILVIIGEGHLENELSELVQKLKVESRVYFLGTKPKAYTWLKGFDLFLLSSLWEGMPNVIMEAMYLKVPIVSTNIDSVRDLLDDKRANLVEPGDIDSMANSILKLLSQSELAQQKVDLAYEEIKNNYSLSRMIDQYDEVYDEKL